MSDLISRQAVLDILSGKNAAWSAYELVDSLPSAQKTGKWIYTLTEPLGYVCSECGKGCCRFAYCPNCGTKMEEEREDDEQ